MSYNSTSTYQSNQIGSFGSLRLREYLTIFVKPMYTETCSFLIKYYLCKSKIMWFLNKKMLRTEDNIAKNWEWMQEMLLLWCGVSVEHLFISCPFTCLLWQIIHVLIWIIVAIYFEIGWTNLKRSIRLVFTSVLQPYVVLSRSA
jgi:hypothetical protein